MNGQRRISDFAMKAAGRKALMAKISTQEMWLATIRQPVGASVGVTSWRMHRMSSIRRDQRRLQARRPAVEDESMHAAQQAQRDAGADGVVLVPGEHLGEHPARLDVGREPVEQFAVHRGAQRRAEAALFSQHLRQCPAHGRPLRAVSSRR